MSFNDNHPTIQCRACMCEKSEFQKFHMITDVEDGMKVYEIFKYITPDIVIQDCDGLPQYICVGCLFKLKQAFQFQEMCIESDKKYRAIDKIKKEVDDLSDGIEATSRVDGIYTTTETYQIFPESPETALTASMKITLTDQYCKTTCQESDPLEHDEAKSSKNETHICDECEKAFKSRRLLLQHKRLHTDETPFLCPTCGKGFKNTANLRQHVLRHSENPRYQCPHCPRKFPCKSGVIKHQSTHSNTKNHICEVCGSAFKRSYSLRGHMKIHSGKRPHKCEQCPATFITINHLRRHVLIHTGEKPHKCQYCSRSFTQSNELYKHLRIHLGEKVFACTQCKETFKYFVELQEHILKHQMETPKIFTTPETFQSDLLEDIIIKEETTLSI